MTETAIQLLTHVIPVCQWLPQNSPNLNSAFPRVSVDVRKWAGFCQAVRAQPPPPRVQQFPIFPTDARPLEVKEHVKFRFHNNVLWPIASLLQTQGADFDVDSRGLLGSPDYVLRTNNQVPKMPLEMETRYDLDLHGYNFWEIYHSADRRNIGDPNLNFKNRILLQIFGEMACNGLHYGILTSYSDTYFLKREEADPSTLYISRVFRPDDSLPTIRECVYYISQLAINDIVGNRLERVIRDNNDDDDNNDSDHDDPDDPNDPDYSESSNDSSDANYSSKGKRKQSSSSSKGITAISEYIDGGSFGQDFSGYYDNQAVAWKVCDTYKKQEEMKTLKNEAHIYSVLKECQGHVIPHLFYKGYIYDGYLFALALQLVENAHHIDPTLLTKKEKRLVVNQLKSIHNFGILHNDISQKNILYEPKNHQFFFIDFGLSVIVDDESPKLRKEVKKLKRLLQL